MFAWAVREHDSEHPDSEHPVSEHPDSGPVGALDALASERRELDAREAAWLGRVAAYDRSGEWRADGFASAASALRAVCRMTHGAARGHVELARKLRHLPRTRAAFEAGDISRAHAVLIADAYTPERGDAIREIEPTLVDSARRLAPRDLAIVVTRATDALDGDGGMSRERILHARRRLHVSPSLDGMGFVDGRLDPEGTEVVCTALDAEMQRDRRSDETRTAEQRRHDALVNICRSTLAGTAAGPTRRSRPHVTVVVDLERLEGGAALVPEARAEAAHLGHLSDAMLARLACDCDVNRVVMAGRSQVVDVGRSTRTVPQRLWRALVARDRRCRAEGCDRPPGRCDAHHVVHWAHGGATDLDNLVLLCWEHHRAVHLE